MKKIAVIGLGIMDRAIVEDFLKSGREVYVWNRSPVVMNKSIRPWVRTQLSHQPRLLPGQR